MKWFLDRNTQVQNKPLPPCNRSKFNVLDLSIGVVRTKLLTDKANGDGYPICRCKPDFVKKAINTLGFQVTSKLWKCAGKRPVEKPLKMLIAQEMSSGMESMETPPSVVAKLMGLNSLPVQPTCKRNLQESYSQDCPSRAIQDYRQQDETSCDQIQYRSGLCAHEKKYKDVYEVKQHLSTDGSKENQNLHGDNDESLTEKRLALVHQKFSEAKHLASNKRLLQSKEFKEALEVLTLNRDLLFNFLEEPSLLFCKQLKELQRAVSLGPQTRRITVLKPTTSATHHEKSVRKNRYTCEEIRRDIDVNDWSSSFYLPKAESESQHTRIVVLKASPTIPDERRSNLASHISLLVPESRCISGNMIINEDIRSREVAKEINQQMQKDLRIAQKDHYLTTSVLFNGYVADESSLNGSENDHIKEGRSDCSYSELATPTSQKSWDHKRSSRPGPVSSLGRESYSPESTVSREAKKRLSERWVLVSSNDISRKQPGFNKSSSTLCEMLRIPEIKSEERIDRLAISSCGSFGHEQHMNMTGMCSPSGGMQESSEDTPKNFTRSKCRQPASACYENDRVNEEISRTLSGKSIIFKEAQKMKHGKSSFKEKVSGLFFFRMKKLMRDKPSLSTSVSTDGRVLAASSSAVENKLKFSHDGISDENASKALEDRFAKVSSPPAISLGASEKRGKVSVKAIRSIEKLWKSENSTVNSNHPSHVSVLERPFQEDFVSNIHHSSQQAITDYPEALSRAPLIESVSRSLNWENAYLKSEPPNSLKLFKLFSKEDEEQERFNFIEKLLSSSNLTNESSTRLLAKSHSLDGQLDPILLEEFLERKGEDAKCRERRSNQRLLFDCVNVVLKNICRRTLVDAYPWSATSVAAKKRAETNPTVADEVYCYVKDCFSKENCISDNTQNNSKPHVDYLVKKEVAGSGLAESMWLEKDELSKEIGEKVLEELFDDALADLTGLAL